MATKTKAGAAATRERVLADGAIQCIRMNARGEVVEACRAAGRGGLRVLEITLTTPGALEAIRELSRDADLLVGSGTTLTVADVEAVAAAGGRFALSPVFDADVLAAARAHDLLAIPGAATPTEILAAHRAGAALVKVFPADALGGPLFLRRVRGPLPDVPLVPTGGPTADNLAEYFAAGAAAVGIGAEVVRDGASPAAIEAAARRVRAAIDAARRA